MIEKPLPTISSKPFTYYDKRDILVYLTKEKWKKLDEYLEEFTKFLKDIITSVVDKDLVFLGSRPYCKKRSSYFFIRGSDLGIEPIKFKTCTESANFRINIDNFSLPYFISSNLGEYLKEHLDQEHLDMVKEGIIKYFEMKHEVDYFGEDDDVIQRTSESIGHSFPGINTLGQLYAVRPEYYKIVYDRLYDSRKSNDCDLLLEKLKKALLS